MLRYIEVLILLLAMVSASAFSYLLYFDKFSLNTKTVEISKGSSVKFIAKELRKVKVIRSEKLFILSVFLKRVQDNLKAGEYEFKPGINLNDIINKFIKGEVKLRKATIPEGKNIYEIAGIFEKAGIIKSKNFLEFAFDKEFVSSHAGVRISTLEGYLFPDTYFFPKGVTAKEIIGVMTKRFKNIYQKVKNSSSVNGLSDHEIVTLASLIEKETGFDSERRLISAVFHNRLKKGMKLQCDPTVIYGLGPEFDGNITKSDLLNYTPYNTYAIFGLPPGPIANPGKESIYAAMNPVDVDYLFFVAKGDGSHFFSTNYKSHLRAVKKYIININN